MSATLQSSDTRNQGDKDPSNVVGQPMSVIQQPPNYIPLTPVNQTAPEPNDNHDQFRYGHQQMENPLDSWMTPAVLACLCCCCPLGLAAIFKALDVQKAINNGDRQQAEPHLRRLET
ncbi:uncharacterized protein [Ptychodera flava]|uniref:uncharacterized protein isoform X2 n=1 Tax=Ptychodera flava TaxID=63121 RepID=UPI003969DB56